MGNPNNILNSSNYSGINISQTSDILSRVSDTIRRNQDAKQKTMVSELSYIHNMESRGSPRSDFIKNNIQQAKEHVEELDRELKLLDELTILNQSARMELENYSDSLITGQNSSERALKRVQELMDQMEKINSENPDLLSLV